MKGPFIWLTVMVALSIPVRVTAEGFTITSFVSTMKQDSPVQVLGLFMPKKIGKEPGIVVRNASEKHVLDFDLLVFSGSLRPGKHPFEEGAPFGRVEFLQSRQRTDRALAPGSDGEVVADGLRSSNGIEMAKTTRSNCVLSLVGVSRILFSDGTNWKWSPSDEELRQIWKEAVSRIGVAACDASSATEDTISKLRGATYDGVGTPTNAESRVVQVYSVTCNSRSKNGFSYVACPM